MTIHPRHLHAVLHRFRAGFLAAFAALSADDLNTILAGDGETLLALLQTHYGYTRAEAKTAWNDFVLTHVDGHPDAAGICGRPAARWSSPLPHGG